MPKSKVVCAVIALTGLLLWLSLTGCRTLLPTGDNPVSGGASPVFEPSGNTNTTPDAAENAPEPPKPADTGNICARNPDVQRAILAALNSSSCRLTTGPELFRMQEMEVATDTLDAGALNGLVSLETLIVNAARVENGALDGLVSLEHLEMTLTEPPPDGVFRDSARLKVLLINLEYADPFEWTVNRDTMAGMPRLASLSIHAGSTYADRRKKQRIHLADNAFEATPKLNALHISADAIAPGALRPLTELTELSISSSGEPDDPRPLFLDGNPGLTSVSIGGFTPIHFASYASLCRLRHDGFGGDGAYVNGSPAAVIRSDGYDPTICHIGIGVPLDEYGNNYPEEVAAIGYRGNRE